jgi:hypothetical protein
MTLILCFLSVGAVQAAPSNPQRGPFTDGGPAVAIDGQTIVVSGATKDDVLYAGGLEVRGGSAGLAVENRVASAIVGNDGGARLDMKARITVRSVWIVVDGKGGYTVFPGPGMVIRQLDLPGSPGVAGNDGQVRKLALKQSSVFVFLVRPTVGMWSGEMWDGHENDDDHAINGSVSSDLQALLPVAGTTVPPPDHLLPGDVLFVVNPYSLQYAVARQGR